MFRDLITGPHSATSLASWLSSSEGGPDFDLLHFGLHQLGDLRRLQRLVGSVVEFGDDVRRRSCRRVQRGPERCRQFRIAGLGERRDVRQLRNALLRRHRQDLQLAALDMLDHRGRRRETQVAFAGQHLHDGGRVVAIGDVGHGKAHRLRHDDPVQVRDAAGAESAVEQRLGAALRVSDELLDVLDRRLVGVDRQRQRSGEEQRH